MEPEETRLSNLPREDLLVEAEKVLSYEVIRQCGHGRNLESRVVMAKLTWQEQKKHADADAKEAAYKDSTKPMKF